MTMRWEKVNLKEREGLAEVEGAIHPGKRWGHTCNSVKDGRFLYVFGGYGKDNCPSNNVHVFDTAKKTWTEPKVRGSPPSPRDSHSCTTVDDNLYVFGGTDGSNPLSDIHIFDTASNLWISPTIRGDAPPPREGHSAVSVGKRIFVFGGCGKSPSTNEDIYFNDLYVFNTEIHAWREMVTYGNIPSQRDSHSISTWRNKIILIGGEDKNDYYLSDVHVLDIDRLVWKELRTIGKKLPPRAGHSTVAVGNNIFVFGGFSDAENLFDDVYMLSMTNWTWTKVVAVGDKPSARFSASGAWLHPSVEGALVFFGGCNSTLEPLDDLFFLHTGLTDVQDEHRAENLSMRKQLKLKWKEEVEDSASDYSLVPHDVRGSGEGKIFQAKVTETFDEGYSIETCIDGKALRGILFSNRVACMRKRATAEEEAEAENDGGDDRGMKDDDVAVESGVVPVFDLNHISPGLQPSTI